MKIVDRVYRIPARFDQKVVLVEFNYLLSYLRNEKKFISMTLDHVSALEHSYRTHALAFMNAADAKTPIQSDLPQTDGFRAFQDVRLKFSDRLLDVATRISALLNTGFHHEKSKFETASNQLTTELKNLQSGLQSPLDTLFTSIAGYDKYFKQLQQCYSATAHPSKATKAVQSLDEKLARVRNTYSIFHRKFVDYCAAREPLFTQIETVVATANVKLADLLGIVSQVDAIVLGDLAEAPEKRISLVEEEPSALPSDQLPEEEDEPETPFQVKLSQPLNVDSVLLPINYPFAVVDSTGKMWQLRDKAGKVWIIPQIYLVPEFRPK
jgi:hypothetical protein